MLFDYVYIHIVVSQKLLVFILFMFDWYNIVLFRIPNLDEHACELLSKHVSTLCKLI